jgi:hypothetical protein
LEVYPKDIEKSLDLSISSSTDPDICEAEGYHIEALHLKYLTDYDIFGNPDYNNANFRIGNDGLFYYKPERVNRTEYSEDGNSSYQVFDHWKFTEEELSPTPISVVDSARNIDSDHGEILYILCR